MERHFCTSFAVKTCLPDNPVTLNDLHEANSNGLDKKKGKKKKNS